MSDHNADDNPCRIGFPVRFSWMEEQAILKSIYQTRLGAGVDPRELPYSCDGVPENMPVIFLDKTKQRCGEGVFPLPDGIDPEIRKKESLSFRETPFVVLENNNETEQIVITPKQYVIID